MPVYASQVQMKVVPYKKVGDRCFMHNFPGIAIWVDVRRFLGQVRTPFRALQFEHFLVGQSFTCEEIRIPCLGAKS